MLSTLSINANGEVVGGSTKFKSNESILHEQPQPQQQEKIFEFGKDSLSTAQIDMLKGDLQDLEASIDNDNRSKLDYRGGSTPADGQACEATPTPAAAPSNGAVAEKAGVQQASQPILIRSPLPQAKQQRKKVAALRGVVAQSKDKAADGVHPKWRVRFMTEADLEEVLRIQRLCYEPEYREQPESYTGRIRLYPQGNVIVEVPVVQQQDDESDDDLDNDCSSDSDNDSEDLDNDVCNDSSSGDDSEESDSEDSDNDVGAPEALVTKHSPLGSPSAVHSVKKRRVAAAAAASVQWRMAGYIQAQPFLREGINDVNDLAELERWLAAHPTPELDLLKDVVYIHEIAMDPAFRGQGLTTPLTDYVDELTRGEGFPMVTLVSLGPALGFWKRNGFVLIRELDYGGHTCYYMEKALALADR